MTISGIRSEKDLTSKWSQYIIDSVELANNALVDSGERFYFDTIDVHQQVIGGKHCWDMYGWIVSTKDAGWFEPLWLAWRDEELDDGRAEYVSVSFFKGSDGMPVVTFDRD